MIMSKTRKLFQKTVAFSAVAVLSLGLLAGCSGNSDSQNTSTTSEAPSTTSEVTEVREINVAQSSTVSPNHFIDEDGVETGYEVAFIAALQEVLPQYKFNTQSMEFASLFTALQSDTIDVAIGNIKRNEERDAGYAHTYYAYNYSPMRLAVAEDNEEIKSLEDCSGKKVGISQGMLQVPLLEAIDGLEIVYTKDFTSDMAAGRIDAFVTPEFSIPAYNEAFEDLKFKPVGDPIKFETGPASDDNAYVWFSQGDDQIVKDFSEAIHTLRENGTLEKLNGEFFESNFVTRIDTSWEEQLKADFESK